VLFSEVENAPLAFEPEEAGGIQRFSRSPDPDPVYLWLCCEGWMRFGPFKWLRFDDSLGVIADSKGNVAAKKNGEFWSVPEGPGKGMRFSNPTITTTREHPQKNSHESLL